MEEKEYKERKEHSEIYSRSVRAGKRTYFFDVKSTKSDELYLTITESKRRFNQENGNFFYEKHKLFLYKEDFEKFLKGLNDSITFIETGERIEPENEDIVQGNEFSDVDFDTLDAGNEQENK